MIRLLRLTALVSVMCALLPATAAAASKPRAYAFFSQFCTDCKEKAPLLRAWAREQRRAYTVIGVGFMETHKDARRFARELKLGIRVTGDPNGELAERVGIWSPTKIVLTRRDGSVERTLDYANWKGVRASTSMLLAASKKPRRARVCRAPVRGVRGLYQHVRCKGAKRKPASRCERKHRRRWKPAPCRKPKTEPTSPPVATNPQYVGQFDLADAIASSPGLLVRYLRLDEDNVDADREFAAGAAADTANAIRSVAVMCGTPVTAPPALAKARITAPVLVDTGADCRPRLDGQLTGAVAHPESAPQRLWLQGRPLASNLMVTTKLSEFNAAAAAAGTALAIDHEWMRTWALHVPPAPNIVRSASLVPATPAVVQHFWYLCPGCVADEDEFGIEQRLAESGQTVVGATCDSNVSQASNWIYEHGWTFPVIVYAGPLSFGECFAQLAVGQLGMSWYGDRSYAFSPRE